MNTKLFFTAIAIVATFSVAVTAITTNVSAQNMTGGGNMTTQGTNMTDMNATGSISQIVPGSEQGQESGNVDISPGSG